MNERNLNRREALGIAGSALVGARVLPGQSSPHPVEGAPADPRPEDLANAFEFEEQAREKLAADVFGTIEGSDREPFDRLTFRPRMCVPVLDMDLGVSIFGTELFTPIVVGPVAELTRYHDDGEAAMVRGAAAAHTLVVVGDPPGVPIARLVEDATMGLWSSVYLDPGAPDRARAAVADGATAVLVAVGGGRPVGTPDAAAGPIDWAAFRAIRDAVDVPVAAKGILSVDEAGTAISEGAAGIVVSASGRGTAEQPPMDALPAIVEAVGGRVPVMVDGSFRRGTDVLKALIFGADAILVARPAAWGLAAYGDEGVRSVLELIQNELARSMAMLGAARPADLSRDHIRIHARATD